MNTKEREPKVKQKTTPSHNAKDIRAFVPGVEGDTVVVLSDDEVKEANVAAKELAEYWMAYSSQNTR